MLLITTNDRKLIPDVHRAAGFGEERLTAQSAGTYGACLFSSPIEVLSLKRPISKGTSLPGMIDPSLRSNRFLGTLDTSGAIFRPENTQPFRHKGWIFALEGDDLTVAPEARDEHEADFLARNVRGTTALETAGNLIMCRMLRTTAGRARTPDPTLVRDNIVDVLGSLESDGFQNWVCAITCDHVGLVVSRGIPVHWRAVRGEKEGARAKAGVLVGHPHVRATVVTAGEAPTSRGWNTVEPGAAVVVGDLPPATIIPA